ncbi:MAG: hypothetical protein ACSHXK_16180 [Oceanococcus sp.]
MNLKFARPMRIGSLLMGLVLGGQVGLLAASSSNGVVTTPEQARDAFSALSSQQQAALADQLSGLLGRVNFANAVSTFLPQSTSSDDGIAGLLGGALPVSGGLAALNLSLPAEVIALLPSAITYRWETEVNGYKQTTDAVLNLPTLLDVDGDSQPDFNASLSISGANSVTLQVERIAVLNGASIPLKIEAVVADPRATSGSVFALGYDASASRAPDSFTEVIGIGGVLGNTQLTVDMSTSGAGNSLDLLAEQFSERADGSRNPDQTIVLGLAPVPDSANVAIDIGSNTIAVDVGASQRSFAAIEFIDYSSGQAQPVDVAIDQLPTSLSLNFTELNGQRQLSYNASQVVDEINVNADQLSGFGRANQLQLLLGGVPTSLNLDMGSAGEFDLDAGNADLGLLDVVLSNGASASLPVGADGIVMKETPSDSVLTARITRLRRISGQQQPLSIYLDSLGAKPVHVELRDKPSSNAKETYTTANLNNLQRQTQISISDGSKQQINYSAAAAASSLVFETNAGSRDKLTASASPVASNIAICAAGDKSCSTSGKAGNTGSFRVVTSQPMTLNLRDCNNSSCSKELKISNFNIRHVDMAINVGKNCTFWGSCTEGSKGSIWLDTDNHSLTGRVISRSGLPVDANFGPGFKTNNRYVTWNWFVPSKSGSISCGSGSYLKVTVFGITLDIKALYLC